MAQPIRPVFDPETLPVVSTGADLPAVAPGRLTPNGLRARFEQRLHWETEATEGRWIEVTDPRVAAVLVPLVVELAAKLVYAERRVVEFEFVVNRIFCWRSLRLILS